MKTSLLLVLLGATSALAHFKSGGSCAGDEKKRVDTCKPLCHHNPHPSSPKSTSKPLTTVPTVPTVPTIPPVSSGCGYSSGSGEFSGSGVGSGSWDFESSNCTESGSGSWDVSGSGEISGSGSEGSGGWEEGEYCFLLEVFLNYSITIEIIEIRQIFIEWIKVTQLTIIQDSSLTEYQMLVKVWYSLQILFEQYQEIEIAIKFLYIGEWGFICDLEGLALDIQTEFAEITLEEVIKIDVTTKSCPLFDALDECGQNGTASQQAAIKVLIQKLTVIINGYYSFSETLVLISKEFSDFFIQYPDLKELIFNGEIEQFGILKSFIDLCKVYWRIDNFELSVGGSTSTCELLISLDGLWKNTTYSTSQRSDFKALYTKISAYFEVEVSVQLRVQYFTEQIYQLLILAEWDISALYIVEIKGYGSLYDLIYAYVYCINHGVTPGDFTVSTEATTPTSTSTSTSTSTTTTTTTTKPNGNCGTVTSVNVVSGNITKLLSSIDADQQVAGKWTTNEINTFLGYKKKIYNVSINTTITATQKFTTIKQTLLTFAGSTTTVYQKVHAVFIVSWGTVAQYCGCSV